jgi:hypothetical protein
MLLQLLASPVTAAAKQPAERVEVDLLERRRFEPAVSVAYGLADASAAASEGTRRPRP